MSKRFYVALPEPWLTRYREAAKAQGVTLEQWLREALELVWARGGTTR